MAGRSDISAGRAFVSLYMKSDLKAGLLNAKKHLQDFGSGVMKFGSIMTGIGTSLGTALAAAVGHFANAGSVLSDMSGRTGIAVESLSELKFAAEQTGATLEDVEMGIRAMQKNGLDASKFDEYAASIAAIEDPSMRAKRAMDVFGKSGTKLLPMVANLAALRQEARDLGIVMDGKTAAAADNLGDAWDKVKSAVMGVVVEVGGALAPAVLPILEQVKNIAVSVNKWVRANGEVVRTAAKIAIAVTAAGIGITAIGGVVYGLGAAFGVVATVLGGIVSAIGFLISPVGLLVAGITAAVVYWAKFTDSGKATVESLKGLFAGLATTIKDTIGGVADAISAGDLQLAMEVLKAGMAVAWAEIGNRVNKVWEDAKWWFVSVWSEATTSIAKTFTDLWAGVRTAWVETVSFLEGTWNTFSTAMLNTWDAIEEKIRPLAKLSMVMNGMPAEKANEIDNALAADRKTRVEKRGIDSKTEADRIESERKASRAKIDSDATGAKAILEDNKLRAEEDRNRKYEADLAANQKALDEARAALGLARGTAAEAARKAEYDAALKKAAPGAGALAGTGKSFASFSAAAALAGGRGGVPIVAAFEKVEAKREKAEVVRHRELIAAVKAGAMFG